ncbi:hypothetical protein AnigIFM60653_003768 [Aspergillus niger]|nr:hypothetical protein AnigIFM60653_003768 [Aspergillus niger]
MSLTEAIGQSAQRVIEQIIEQIVLEPTVNKRPDQHVEPEQPVGNSPTTPKPLKLQDLMNNYMSSTSSDAYTPPDIMQASTTPPIAGPLLDQTLDKDATEAVSDQFINYGPDDKDTNDDHVSNRGPPGDGDHVACDVA